MLLSDHRDDASYRSFQGLTRAGFSETQKRALKNAYRMLFKSGVPLSQIMNDLEKIDDENVSHLVSFMRGSKRGITRR